MIGEWIGNYSPPPAVHLPPSREPSRRTVCIITPPSESATADTWRYFLRLPLQLIVHRDYRLGPARPLLAISILLINGALVKNSISRAHSRERLRACRYVCVRRVESYACEHVPIVRVYARRTVLIVTAFSAYPCCSSSDLGTNWWLNNSNKNDCWGISLSRSQKVHNR